MNGRGKNIVIIDYGMGNIHSIMNALIFLGIPAQLSANKADAENADALILPGVGAFPSAVHALELTGLKDAVIKAAAEKPVLGICLGMQLLFESSDEVQLTSGLALIPGHVRLLDAADVNKTDECHRQLYKVPHIGWNPLSITKRESPLLHGVKNGDCVYFVHSYKAIADNRYISSVAEYGESITASVENGFVYGTQFHPEKSGESGLRILKNFCDLIK